MNQQALEAAAEGIFDYAVSVSDDGGVWKDCQRKEAYTLYARAALTAYAEAVGERTLHKNWSSDTQKIICGLTTYALRSGEELVVRTSEGRTDGK